MESNNCIIDKLHSLPYTKGKTCNCCDSFAN